MSTLLGNNWNIKVASLINRRKKYRCHYELATRKETSLETQHVESTWCVCRDKPVDCEELLDSMKKFINKEKQRKKEMLYYNRGQQLVEKRYYRRMQKEKKQYQRWIKLENEMEENQI